MKEWLTVKEAGELLEISSRQVINRIHRGKLQARKDGRIWQIHRSLAEAPPVTEEAPEEAGVMPPVTGEAELIKELRERRQDQKGQIEEKDKQMSELHQMLMVSESNQRQMLEDKRSWWERWRQKRNRTDGGQK